MCGILGSTHVYKEDTIRNSLECFSYRGPDYTGYYKTDEIALGHNRLSIIDIDRRSNQPFCSNKKNIVLVFNGEVYNFKELRKELRGSYEFRTDSDTEVIIAAYSVWGIDMVSKLQGMFAFAIYDKTKNLLHLVRDHTGIKPLYYYIDSEGITFSSQMVGITSLLKNSKIDLTINRDSIDMFLGIGYITSPHTMCNNVYKLMPSTYITYDLERKEIQEKNKFTFEQKKNEYSHEDYRLMMEKNIVKHTLADVPVGVFFSGGIDSSMITSVLNNSSINLSAFTVMMPHKNPDSEYAAKIASLCNITQKKFLFSKETFDDIYYSIMNRIDEPLHDASLFPTYYVSLQASKEVKVVLSGEGGDEFFYGYNRHKYLYAMKDTIDYNISLIDRVYFLLPIFKGKNILFSYVYRLFSQPISYYLCIMRIVHPGESIKVRKQLKEYCKKYNITALDLDKKLYLENDLLRKIDFATSYSSIEGRVPLLDQEIIMGSYQFEKEKVSGTQTKSFLKRILCNYLPQSLVYREKSGFGIPIRDFFTASKYLEKDFTIAYDHLFKQGLVKEKLPKNIKRFNQKFPTYSYSIVILYHSLKNNYLLDAKVD